MDLTGRNVVYLGGFGGIGQKACAELLQRQLQVSSAQWRLYLVALLTQLLHLQVVGGL